jgi:hypothetical protein
MAWRRGTVLSALVALVALIAMSAAACSSVTPASSPKTTTSSSTTTSTNVIAAGAPTELPPSCTAKPVLAAVAPTPTWPSGYEILDAVPGALLSQYPTVYGGIEVAPAVPGESAVEVNSRFIILERVRDPQLEAEVTAAYPKPLTVAFGMTPRSYACITDVQKAVEASTAQLQAAGIDMFADGLAATQVVVSVTTCGSKAGTAKAWFAKRWGAAVQVQTCQQIPTAS